MDTRVEKKQLKKHKPKRKVSELDEIVAKRRRTQASLAQRAFRQRKEDTIASLNAQVTNLHKTIESLNVCFLTLTDELVASRWLEHDPQVTQAVYRTIERFITVVRESQVPQENSQTVSDCNNSDSMTTGPLTPKNAEAGVLLPANESVIIISDTGSNSSTTISQDIYAVFNRPHNAGTSEREEMLVQSVRNTALSKAPNRLTGFQSSPYELIPTHNDAFSFMSQLPGSLDSLNLTFAQRLHLEAIRGGLRLVCTAEDHSLEFYRVFNHVLNFHSRERLRAFLNTILENNFNQLLRPPPESDLDKLWSGGLSRSWLNASDVARHFHTIGMDLDGSQDIATFEIYPGSLPARLLNVQELPATSFITLCGDASEESQHQQPPQHLACLSSTTHDNFTATVQDVNDFGIRATNLAYTTQSHDRSHITIDVSRLIHEIVLGTRCFDTNPAFNRNDLDGALARAVIETH